MGERRWRPYNQGRYRLGTLGGEAVAIWTEHGKRRRWRLGVHTELEGRAQLDVFARQRETILAARSGSVGEIMEAYIQDRERDGKQAWVMRANYKALEPRFGSLSPQEIDDDMCRSYAQERFEQGRSPSTVWTELSRLRSGLNWAAKRNLIRRAPHIWTPLKPKGRERVLTEGEVLKLLRGCQWPHIRLFVILALMTGGRTGAILELTWDRVDFVQGTIDLKKPETVDPLKKVVRKGRAVVPMNDLSRAALFAAKESAISDHVIEWSGQPVSTITRAFNRARDLAKLGKDVTPHVLRHTAASWALNKDVPLKKISEFLGHKDMRTTELIYAKAKAGFTYEAARAVELKVVR